MSDKVRRDFVAWMLLAHPDQIHGDHTDAEMYAYALEFAQSKQSLIDAKDAEIEKRGEYIDSLHKKIRELHDMVLNTPVDIIRDVDGTFFTQQVIHKELSIGKVFRIVIGE